jgi:hypothetical protein
VTVSHSCMTVSHSCVKGAHEKVAGTLYKRERHSRKRERHAVCQPPPTTHDLGPTYLPRDSRSVRSRQ